MIDNEYKKFFFERLSLKLEILENGCLNWKGFKNAWGYPRITYKKKTYLGNRLIWELNFGKIPEGKIICHTCDNPGCLEIKHLYLGTFKDNIQDCILRNRHKFPRGSESPNAKLKENEVKEIRKLMSQGATIRYISKKYNIGITTVFRIKHNISWKHVGS